MSRVKILTKYFIKSAIKEMFNDSKMSPAVIILLMLLAVGFISIPIAMMVGVLYEPFAAIGQEGFLLAMLLFMGATVTFFFGVYTVLNVFYFAEDIEQILPLPFKGEEIVFGKFMAVMINMYFYSLILVLPLIVYGVSGGMTIVYYLYVILAIIVTPILPMIIASLIAMVLMRFTNLSKHKDAFKIFTGVLSLILVIVFNMFTQSGSNGMDEEALFKMISSGENGMMDMLTGIFITNKFSSYGLLYSSELKGLFYILLALILSIFLFVVYYKIGGKIYLKGVIGISEAYGKRESILKDGDSKKYIKGSSPIKALAYKDIKIMIRTPQFFINCIAMIFYMPAILLVMFVSGRGGVVLNNGIKADSGMFGVILSGIFLFIAFSITSAGAANTALSREGKDISVSKYIPISYKVQMQSKIISSLCINGISSIFVLIALIYINLPIYMVIFGTLIAIVSVLFISLLGIYLDYKSPKLNWESEKSMYKNNYKPLLILIGMGILAGIFFAISGILKNEYISFVVIVLTLLLGSFSVYKKLEKDIDEIYSNC